MPAYDPENIFAKIIAGTIPSHKVYEDETLIAVMDVFPQSRGHTLVIPKAGSRNLLDADPSVLSAIMPALQKLARAVKSARAVQRSPGRPERLPPALPPDPDVRGR